MLTGYKIYPLGDEAITLSWGNTINEEQNRQIILLGQNLACQNIPGVLDIIPAYSSLTLIFNYINVLQQCKTGQSPFELMHTLLTNAVSQIQLTNIIQTEEVSLPVCYHLSLAPDLEYIAHLHKLTVDQVVDIHAATTYRVYMNGFLPGFPYLGTVDAKIATARRPTPRTLVLRGSVGIAGSQTGIYPFDSPGGWQIIGRTPVKLFRAHHNQPVLLQPGQTVRLCPISLADFHQQLQA